MFWLTSLQNTLFPFSLATYEESRVKKNTIYLENCSLISITHDATMHDARRTSRALASLLYFFFPATSVLVALVVMVFFKYPKKLDQDGYKAFFLAPVYLNTCLDSQKKKKTLFNCSLFNDEDAIRAFATHDCFCIGRSRDYNAQTA